MKTNEKIIILMAIAITLIILSNFITLPNQNKLNIKIINQKAVKLNTENAGECLYKLNITILNEGKKIKDATIKIKLIKNKEVVEEDGFQTGEIDVLETRNFQRNYTRNCNYLDNFNISFSK